MTYTTLDMLFLCGKKFRHKKARSCGISDTECLICSFIYSNEKCSQDDIVKSLRIDKTTVAKAMLTLEAKGYIVRCAADTDRRKKSLSLTPAGLENISSIIDFHNSWFNRIVSTLTPDELSQFNASCEKLLNAAEELLREER